jgi:high affinity Mn2+ porin
VVEFETPVSIFKKKGIIRVLGFYKTTQMGNYQQALVQSSSTPNIVSTRAYGRNKYGFGINLEQEIDTGVGLFARASWNDGKNETWAFTQIDQSASIGLVLDGLRWKRDSDVLGIASVVSGISEDHRNYLAAGGLGFIIGDGRLNYGREWVTEFYYRAKLFSDTFFVTANYQLVTNPAYNRERGPAHVIGLRVHIEF